MADIFASRTLVRLLSVFLMEQDKSFYQQELVRMVGGPLRPVQLALKKLTRADLITERREGKQVYYSAAPSHPAFGDLRALFTKTLTLADVLRGALTPMGPSVEYAFVYGSLAAGEQRPESDIDVLVVGDAGRRDLAVALDGVQERLGREVNLSIYTPARLAAAHGSGDPFVRDVMVKPKIWLVGDQGGLEELARGGADQAAGPGLEGDSAPSRGRGPGPR